MSYVNAYKSAKQMLESIHSGQARQESKAKVVGAREELEQGLVRRKRETQQEQGENPLGFLPEFLQLASATPEVTEDRQMADPATGAPQVTGSLQAAREAIAQIESSGNYQAKGKVMEKGMYKGQYAVGRYQVMQGNIGPWTKEVTGRAYTEAEFLANKDGIQDRVAEYKLAKSYKKYGSWEDAASVWFSGQPVKKAGNRSDGLTTVPNYVKKFQNAFSKYQVKDEGTKEAPHVSPRPKSKGFVERPKA